MLYTFAVEYPFPPVGIVGAADGKNRRAFLCSLRSSAFRIQQLEHLCWSWVSTTCGNGWVNRCQHAWLWSLTHPLPQVVLTRLQVKRQLRQQECNA